MKNDELANFIFKARSKTSAKLGGEVSPALKGTTQAEYKEGDFLYRDVYYDGSKSFSGIEGVFYKESPVWSCSYFGKCEDSDWDEIDPILQKVQKDHPETMGWKYVEAEYDGYKYICDPDLEAGIEEIGGTEIIFKGDKQIYTLYYAGSSLA